MLCRCDAPPVREGSVGQQYVAGTREVVKSMATPFVEVAAPPVAHTLLFDEPPPGRIE